MSSVFTRIIRGEIPAYRVFENDYVLAILARDQIRLGHTLIIPKIEVDYFVDVPEPYYSEVFRVAKDTALAIQAATGCTRVGTLIDGREIAHFHYHLVPLNQFDQLSFTGAKQYPIDLMEDMASKIGDRIRI